MQRLSLGFSYVVESTYEASALGRMRPVGLGQPSDGGPVLFLLMPVPSSLAPNI